MVSRLRPIEVRMAFDWRRYNQLQLGGEVEVEIELIPRRDVLIREARIDLMCDLSYVDMNKRVSLGHLPGREANVDFVGGDVGRIPWVEQSPTVTEPSETTETHTFRGEPFLVGRRLSYGSRVTEQVMVSVPSERPQTVGGSHDQTAAKLDWRLVAIVDISGGRDITTSVPIRIGYLPTAGTVYREALERRREEARRAAQDSWDQSQRGGRDTESDSQ